MNYEMEVSQSRPASFNSLDGSLPPLVAGSGSSTRLNSSLDVTFPAFNKGYGDTPFTLEVWFLPLTNTGQLVVIGHADEGVLWDGSKFILRIKLGDGSNVAETTWTPVQIKAFHVVMIYTPGQVILYIDGESVASLELDNLDFFATGSPIRLNGGTGSGLYDSRALYYRSLTTAEVKQHYSWGNSVPSATEIATAKGATTWSLLYDDVDILESFVFEGLSLDGPYIINAGIEDNVLVAGSGGGVWRQSIPLSSLVTGTLAGIHVTYNGLGVTFSYSLDGTNWTTATNKTTILEDAAVSENTMLFIQIQLANENDWLSALTIDVLANRILRPLSGVRSLAFKSASLDQTPGNQLEYQADWGADMGSGGFLNYTIDSNTDTVKVVGTTEIWVKLNSIPANFTLIDGQLANGSGTNWLDVSTTGAISGQGSVYVNGVLRSAGYVLSTNIWHHIVFVEGTAANITGFIGRSRSGGNSGDVTIGHVAVYSQRMTATEASQLYSFNIGAPALRVNDAGGVTVTESSPAGKIHAYNWSYVSGGS